MFLDDLPRHLLGAVVNDDDLVATGVVVERLKRGQRFAQASGRRNVGTTIENVGCAASVLSVVPICLTVIMGDRL